MLNPGTYNARAKSAQLTETSTGKPQVAVAFEVCDAEFAGQTITWFGFFTEKTEERTIESLRIAGWRGSDIEDLSDLSNPDVPLVQIVVEHEEYNGKTSAKVKWVNREGGATMNLKPLEDGKRKAFAARLKGSVLAFDRKQGGGAPAPQRPAPQRQATRQAASGAPSDDDVPFLFIETRLDQP